MEGKDQYDEIIGYLKILCKGKGKESFYEKWEFWFAAASFITLWLFLFTNAYSMNSVYCPHDLANFLNWLGGMI